jgi:hypothetical protein
MIRRAEERDIPKVTKLLSEVLEIHASIRPDIFVSGKTKYTSDEIKNIFSDDMRPVYVYVDEKDEVQGYAFCEIRGGKKMIQNLIQDLCCPTKSCTLMIYALIRNVAESK